MRRESKGSVVALASPQKSTLPKPNFSTSPKRQREERIFPSPIKAAIQKRLPDPALFEEYIKRFLNFDDELGIQAFSAISQYFYVAYSREAQHTDSFSILDTIDYELRTGRNIRGIDHKFKAACIYNSINKAIAATSAAIHQYPDEVKHLQEFHSYLIALNSRLARELKSIEDPTTREKIKEHANLDLDKLEIYVLHTPERKAVKRFHATPERNGSDDTPKAIKNLRRHAQWGMQDDIRERKRRRESQGPKTARKLEITDDRSEATFEFAQPVTQPKITQQPTTLKGEFVPFSLSLGTKKTVTRRPIKFNIFSEMNPEAVEKETKKVAESQAIEMPVTKATPIRFNLFSQKELSSKKLPESTSTINETKFGNSQRQ